MTTGGRKPVCHFWLRSLSSCQRGPACMDAGGRAVSGTKAEESTDLRLHYQVALRAYWHQSEADKARAGAPGPLFQGIYRLFQIGRFIAYK